MSEITKENFTWRTKDKETPLEEMDTSFKIVALIHCLKHMDINHSQHESMKERTLKIRSIVQEEAKQLNAKIKEFNVKKEEVEFKIEKLENKMKRCFSEMDKFSNYGVILENSIKEDGYAVPETIQDLHAFRRMLDKGLIAKNIETHAS